MITIPNKYRLHYTSQPSLVRKTTEITVSRRVAVGHEREAVIRCPYDHDGWARVNVTNL